MSRVKKAILITFLVILMLTVLILGIIWAILTNGNRPTTSLINYEQLSIVMEDDIVYLSDKFFESNDLEIEKILLHKVYGVETRDVSLSYNSVKVKGVPDFNSRVENIAGCCYTLHNSEISENIPIKINVGFYQAKLTTREKREYKDKYNEEYNGYQYCQDNSRNGRAASYYIMTQPKKKATCIVQLSFEIEDEDRKEYTEEEINARIEELFKSAVDNIVLYSEFIA